MDSASDPSLEDDNQVKGPSSDRANSGLEDFLKTQFGNDAFDIDAFELSVNYVSATSAGYSSPSVKLEQQPLEGVVADQMADLLSTPSLEPKHPVKEHGVTVDTSKDAVAVEDHQTLKSNGKDVIMIDDDNQPITVKKEGGETINRWQYDPKEPIDLVSDDENDSMQISTLMAKR